MMIDAVEGSPRAPATPMDPQSAVLTPYFAAQQPGYGMLLSDLQRLYAEAQGVPMPPQPPLSPEVQ